MEIGDSKILHVSDSGVKNKDPNSLHLSLGLGKGFGRGGENPSNKKPTH